MSARDALKPLIIAAKSPAQLEQLADEITRLAADLRVRAEALRRQQARPPAARVGPARRKGGRPSAPWVQVLSRPRAGEADNLVLRLSTSLYYAAGSPERLDVQRVGDALLLVPVTGDHGYKVMVNAGGIRIAAAGSRDLIALEQGKYHAQVRGGAIVVGGRFD